MNDSDIWTVDRLAAQNLLADLKMADLKLETTTGILEQLADHFARHRQSAHGWAAGQAHSTAIRMLETASMEYSARKSEEWRSGYRCAEEQLFTTTPEELLDLGPERTRSKGQILRTLVRRAKNR